METLPVPDESSCPASPRSLIHRVIPSKLRARRGHLLDSYRPGSRKLSGAPKQAQGPIILRATPSASRRRYSGPGRDTPSGTVYSVAHVPF